MTKIEDWLSKGITTSTSNPGIIQNDENALKDAFDATKDGAQKGYESGYNLSKSLIGNGHIANEAVDEFIGGVVAPITGAVDLGVTGIANAAKAGFDNTEAVGAGIVDVEKKSFAAAKDGLKEGYDSGYNVGKSLIGDGHPLNKAVDMVIGGVTAPIVAGIDSYGAGLVNTAKDIYHGIVGGGPSATPAPQQTASPTPAPAQTASAPTQALTPSTQSPLLTSDVNQGLNQIRNNFGIQGQGLIQPNTEFSADGASRSPGAAPVRDLSSGVNANAGMSTGPIPDPSDQSPEQNSTRLQPAPTQNQHNDVTPSFGQSQENEVSFTPIARTSNNHDRAQFRKSLVEAFSNPAPGQEAQRAGAMPVNESSKRPDRSLGQGD